MSESARWEQRQKRKSPRHKPVQEYRRKTVRRVIRQRCAGTAFGNGTQIVHVFLALATRFFDVFGNANRSVMIPFNQRFGFARGRLMSFVNSHEGDCIHAKLHRYFSNQREVSSRYVCALICRLRVSARISVLERVSLLDFYNKLTICAV